VNATLHARTAYGRQASSVRTPRAAEYETVARITRALKSAAEDDRGMTALATAIHDNRRLWTRLAADVADPDNGLPRDLRAQIIYLAEFTRVHSGKVLRNEAAVDTLIDINMAVMRGLSGDGDGS